MTLVMPVWDSYAQYVPASLAAIASEWPDAPIIVVDNASSPPISGESGTVLRLERRASIGAARNAALEHVETEWVCFVDADDLPGEGWGRAALTHTAADDVAVVCGRVLGWSPFSRKTVDMGPRSRARTLSKYGRLFGLACIVRNQYPVVGSLLRVEHVRDAGGFADDDYCEDWSLGTCMAFRGRVVLTPHLSVRARIASGSSINAHGTSWGILRRIPSLHLRWLRDPGIPLLVKPLFPVLALQRVKQAAVRAVRRRRSQDDLIACLGEPSVPTGRSTPPTTTGAAGYETTVR